MIIADWRKRGRKGRYVVEYLTKFKGYNTDSDKWLNSRQLRSAPEVLEVWHKKRKPPRSHSVWEIASPFAEFYGILPASPIFPPKIVPWYIKAYHLFQFLQHHSNSLPFAFILFYHAYAIPYPYSSILFLLESSSFQFHFWLQRTLWHPRILFPHYDAKTPSYPHHLWNS